MKRHLKIETRSFHDLCLRKIVLLILMILVMGPGRILAQQEKSSSDTSQLGKQVSLTILPALLLGNPEPRLSEIIGALLEKQGLRNIELYTPSFKVAKQLPLEDLADSAGIFVADHPFSTDYVLYAEMVVDQEKKAITEVIGIVLNNNGTIFWKEKLTSDDEAFRQVTDRDPFGYSILLVQRISPLFGLNEETARNAKPGRMAAILNERSGLPPAEERALIPERQKTLKKNFEGSTMIIFPVRLNNQISAGSSGEITRMLNEKGMCKAIALKDSVLLKSSPDTPNEMKKLWDLAREFRDYVRQHPQQADYFLYADYNTPGYVHFVVCDRSGEWVIADLRNSTYWDYRTYNTMTAEGCNQLVVSRLQNFAWTSVAGIIRESMDQEGIKAANKKFKSLQKDSKGYYVSEDEMNALGYEYLNVKKINEAIEVFKMNTIAYPGSFNTWDSLGEAYAAAGEKDKAISNYEKSLELNPESESGINALKKLKSGSK